jgi:hypothetical protein
LGFSFTISNHFNIKNRTNTECYVGVSFCGNTTTEAKLLIDRVKDYTNLFVLQSGPISQNETATTEICDYAVNSGLYIIVFFGDLGHRVLAQKGLLWRLSWLNEAQQRWGNKFLGIYYYDEPGGIQLDFDWSQSRYFQSLYNSTSRNYAAAEDYFTLNFLDDPGIITLDLSSIDSFTSDYALYWFDYLGGYDVVLAQIGWNHTLTQDIALVRGAANMQNKSWGTIITWKYNHPPYLDKGSEILHQMTIAYECGAKYIVIFNYPQIVENGYGVMTDEHFISLEAFWYGVVNNPEVVHGSIKVDTVLVLPKHYAWGMRHPDDKIWGFWDADENSSIIWDVSRDLLEQYKFHLDMIYKDADFSINDKYSKIYYWNDSIS